MRKIWILLMLVGLLAQLSLAESSKYIIFTCEGDQPGAASKKVIMLNRSTGDSWVFVNGTWQPVPLIKVRTLVKEGKAKPWQKHELLAQNSQQMAGNPAEWKNKLMMEEKLVTGEPIVGTVEDGAPAWLVE